jgi:signal transduction histidine kinase
MFWRSSGIRITVTIMALFVTASVLVVGAIYWQTSQILTRRDISSVITETRTLSSIAARDGTAALLRAMRRRIAEQDGMIYGLADESGQPVWLGRISKWPSNLASDNRTGVFEYMPAPSVGRQTTAARTKLSPGLAIGATLRLPDGARLLVARDVSEHRDLAYAIRNWFLAGLGLLSLLAMVAGWTINRMLMSRIDRMTQTTSGIMAGDLSKRVVVTQARDEFDSLAENLNAMLDRIERLMQGLHEVSDNIAHDLKTPLNRLRIRAEQALRDPRGDVACREGLETTLTEADELIRTFNALLRVARLEAGTLGDNLETFDAAALIRDLAEFYEPVVEEAKAQIAVVAGEPVRLTADRQLISQALTNLLENAIKYGLDETVPAKYRRIQIGVNTSGGGAQLWVSDLGRGINPDDYERVFKRFVRLDTARSKPGTGLGLSLVAAVARQHGGAVDLVNNEPGLRIILSLPPDRLAANSVVPTRQVSHDPATDTHQRVEPIAVKS